MRPRASFCYIKAGTFCRNCITNHYPGLRCTNSGKTESKCSCKQLPESHPLAVHLTSGERIETGMIVCTVGTEAHPLIKAWIAAGKRPIADRPGHESDRHRESLELGRLFACAQRLQWQPSPATAQFAMQQAASWRKILNALCETLQRNHSLFVREACLPPLVITTLWRSFME